MAPHLHIRLVETLGIIQKSTTSEYIPKMIKEEKIILGSYTSEQSINDDFIKELKALKNMYFIDENCEFF